VVVMADKLREAVARALAFKIVSRQIEAGGLADAALSAIAEAGYVVVPREPTETMVKAGWIDKEDVTPQEIWSHMLRASKFCPGCPGYECEDGCAYPGASQTEGGK